MPRYPRLVKTVRSEPVHRWPPLLPSATALWIGKSWFRVGGNTPTGVFSMPADRSEALLDFLLEAVAEEGDAPFPAHVLAGLRRAVPCEAASFHEWRPPELLEFSLVADQPETWMPVSAGLATRQALRIAG